MIQPAAFNLKDAARYCGMSVEFFQKKCPVKPIQFTKSTRGARYLRIRLDEWLASLDPNPNTPTLGHKFGEMAGGH